jgi:hypothetical protein
MSPGFKRLPGLVPDADLAVPLCGTGSLYAGRDAAGLGQRSVGLTGIAGSCSLRKAAGERHQTVTITRRSLMDSGSGGAWNPAMWDRPASRGRARRAKPAVTNGYHDAWRHGPISPYGRLRRPSNDASDFARVSARDRGRRGVRGARDVYTRCVSARLMSLVSWKQTQILTISGCRLIAPTLK